MIPELKEAYPIDNNRKFTLIKKVGLELEGGWSVSPTEFRIHHDGSVKCRGAVKGESRTEPKDSIKGVFDEIALRYPEDIDETCGMHIHTSVKDGIYNTLADREFFDYFIFRMGNLAKYLRNVGHVVDYERFLYRFAGKNQYCERRFIPYEQLKRGGNRRTMINFACYSAHGTFECRLLPMFEKFSNAKLATREYIDTVETYLNNRKNPKPICINISDCETDGDSVDQFIQEASCAL